MSFNFEQGPFVRFRDHYAERRRPIVFWVGAGLSTDAGLPTWIQLRAKIIAQAMETVKTFEPKAAAEAEAKLEEASVDSNLWNAFQVIKNAIKETEFRETLKYVFKGVEDVDPPLIYSALWGLKNIDGILTLNIDGFASRAYSPIRGSKELLNFTGRDARHYMHALSTGRPFVANLHGQKDVHSSWIFTRDEIGSLVTDPAYIAFINYIFSSMTVVFLGISADDLSSGGFLQRLAASGLDVGPHFWITDRRDEATHSWSSSAGIQVIRYQPEPDKKAKLNHSIVLGEIFQNVHEYVSHDKTPAPILPTVTTDAEIPTSTALRSRSDDEIRHVLAAHARKILERNNNDTDCSEYAQFLKNYAPNIHQSWYLTADEPHNIFYGYRVDGRVSSSAFSNVWRLSDEQGKYYALKVMQIDNLGAGAQIESFRRGVQSLSYLTNADVPGIPRLVAAHEIPAAVLMTFIEGRNLHDIASHRKFYFWREGLLIAINVCKHLEYSHNLPQGVLHRDVRPSNIMVPDYHLSDIEAVDRELDRFRAVLLNYDMSWHVNAKGQTIAGNLEEAGFYAPELLEKTLGNIARRTSVDSYGIGMTLFFMYTKTAPPTGGSKSTDWSQVLAQRFRPDNGLTWRSAPERLRRIIAAATDPDDDERINVSHIRNRLELLLYAVQGKFDLVTPDLWAEELLSRVTMSDYEVDDNETEFSRDLKVGRSVTCTANFKRNTIEIRFTNIGTEATDRGRAVKSWGDKLTSAQDILKASGWEIGLDTNYRGMQILLVASLPLEVLRQDITKAANSLNRGLDQVRLD